MYFINQKNEFEAFSNITANLDLDTVPMPGENDLEQELGAYYINSMEKDDILAGLIPGDSMTSFIGGFNPLAIGKKILQKIRKVICAILNEGSTASEIADAVLQALSSIIPGGFIIKLIVQKVVKFIMGKGVGAFCNI